MVARENWKEDRLETGQHLQSRPPKAASPKPQEDRARLGPKGTGRLPSCAVPESLRNLPDPPNSFLSGTNLGGKVGSKAPRPPTLEHSFDGENDARMIVISASRDRPSYVNHFWARYLNSLFNHSNDIVVLIKWGQAVRYGGYHEPPYPSLKETDFRLFMLSGDYHSTVKPNGITEQASYSIAHHCCFHLQAP